jgi:type IV secretory pathway TrbF-like protein
VIGQSPATFPVKNVTYDLSYDFAKIGGQQVVVPVKSDFRASEGKSLVWTEVEFRRYRKPGADPADKFETR